MLPLGRTFLYSPLPNIMKNILFFIFICVFKLNVVSQKNPMDSLGINYLVLALHETIDSNSLPAYCGTKKSEAIIKYKVLDVWKGSYKDSIIHINQDCIRELYEKGSLNDRTFYRYWVIKSKDNSPKKSCNYCLNPKLIYSNTFDIYWEKQRLVTPK